MEPLHKPKMMKYNPAYVPEVKPVEEPVKAETY